MAALSEKHMAFLYLSIGVLLALSTTVNGMLGSVLNPILGAVKGSYA